MNLLVFLHDAFGGLGGISRFNRDLLAGLCAAPGVAVVIALPRLVAGPPEAMPANLDFRRDGLGGAMRYVAAALRLILRRRTDLVLCCHLRLLPLAWLAARWRRVPLVLVIFGIDAWERPRNRLLPLLLRRVDHVLSISRITTERFAAWSGFPPATILELPPCIDLAGFSPGPRDPALEARYGLAGKRVIMTFGRLVSQARAKGMDEVLVVLPSLLRRRPDIAYLIAGDGPDRPRLEVLARSPGLVGHVAFAGRVDETEKAAHYRLADVYAMPSRGEGFGIVLLEAMACGIPVVASSRDGGRDAARDGLLGRLVDPDDLAALEAAILAALDEPKAVPAGLDFFSLEAFRRRLAALLPTLAGRRAR
jgi:glycosyltransferase involved in cell wall biosynthesis